MWYNGVSVTNPSYIIAAIVWKDYNCRDWKVLSSGPSSLASNLKSLITTEATKISRDTLMNDVWGAAHTMMTNLQSKTEFSSNGWTVIMNQYTYAEMYGYVCRVGNNFYNSYTELGRAIVPGSNIGGFHLFQTR